ncbi:MAG: CHAT domain-containing protein [Saprospiraceae bacterium]|nr:CHAT domain-containing protein [Saprospiraceae bacterium]
MMKLTTALCSGLLLLSTQLNAQADSIGAYQSIDLAKACIKSGKMDSLLIYHKTAKAYFKKNNQLGPWLKSYTTLANPMASTMKQPVAALDLVEAGLKEAWRKPETQAEWEQYAANHLVAGHIFRVNFGDDNGAKRYLEIVEGIFRNQLNETSDRLARYLYHNLANIYTRHGDYERAIHLLQRSLAYFDKFPESGVIDHGDFSISLRETGRYLEALDVLNRGLAIEKLSSELKINLYQNRAEIFLKMGNTAAALADLDKIPGLIKEMIKEKGSLDEAYYMMQYDASKAEVLAGAGQLKQAEQFYLKAIKEGADDSKSYRRREISKIYGQLGNGKLKENKAKEALTYFHRALQTVMVDFTSNDPYQLPNPNGFFNENTILEALEGKAKAFAALGQLEKALTCYEMIPLVENKLRASHAYESSSLLALRESRLRFDAAVEIAWQLYEQYNHDRRFADRAFRLTEQARGILLLHSLAEAQAKYQLPENVRRQEEKLKVRMAWYEHEIAAERESGEDTGRLSRLEKELYDLKQENEKFKTELRKRFPDYAALSDEIKFLEAAQVAGLLRSDQVLIDFYLTNETAFIFSFDAKGAVTWRKASLAMSFRESVKTWVEYLQKGDEEDRAGAMGFKTQAADMYRALLEPELQLLASQQGSLLLIPDDALVFVPFEVLLRKPANEPNWRDHAWLIKDFNIGYAYSATLLQMQQAISRKHRVQNSHAKRTFGGFAPTYSAAGIYQLTSTESMVKNAQKILGGDTWSGQEVNEEKFKKIAPECRILLLAMHGLADAENPELSRLLFGDPGPDSLENNNVLYAAELQVMQLQADLAVLSACNTGFGKLQQGEGVFSLARAFARAGVPATVMSMWLLHENTAGPLVQGFLAYLKAGKTKDEALRLAKLDLLNDDSFFAMNHPFYWAGVTTSGDMCALEFKEGFRFQWWLLLLFFAGCALVFLWVKKRNQHHV